MDKSIVYGTTDDKVDGTAIWNRPQLSGNKCIVHQKERFVGYILYILFQKFYLIPDRQTPIKGLHFRLKKKRFC